jgi:hypothetical protein
MNMLLQNTGLLPLALLIAAPILIHLYARARPRHLPFSSVEMLQHIVRKTARIKKPQDLLLLILRTLFIALLVALFLRPLFFANRELAAPGQRKSVIILVDASASMAYLDGAQSRFAAACAEASEVLSGLGANDQANVIWVRNPPRAEFPEPGSNIQYLQEAVRKARVSNGPGRLDAALDLAIDQLGEAEGQKQICIVSDFQRAAWQPEKIERPTDIQLMTVSVVQDEAENQSITRLHVQPALPLVNEDLTIYCEVHNFSGQPVQRPVFLHAGEIRQEQTVTLDPWQSATAIFTARFDQPGSVKVKASLGEDAFPADNQRWDVIPLQPAYRIGMAGDDGSRATWERGLNALGWAQLSTVNASKVNSEEIDLLLLLETNASDSASLQDFLAAGGQVIAPPDGPIRKAEPAISPDIIHSEHPLFTLFESGEFGSPADVRVTQYRTATAGKPLMQFPDGSVALSRDGSRWTWNISLAPEHSDFAQQLCFVPFLGEWLYQVRLSRADTALTAWIPGDRLVFDPSQTREQIEFQDEAGKVLPIEETVTEQGLRLRSEGIEAPGIYTWSHPETRDIYRSDVVNFVPEESDLRTYTVEELSEAPEVEALATGAGLRDLSEGLDLWPYLLLIAALVLVAEQLVTRWAART